MFAPDAVFDVSAVGLGRFEGPTAIHGYLADWYSTSAWEGGMITRVVASRDIDEARAAAECLAEERG
jgi:hypothetical protein